MENETSSKIIRWSWVGNVVPVDAEKVLHQCREEFPKIRFKIVKHTDDNAWIHALLLHERGVGWGQREGEGQREIQQYCEAMVASARRHRKKD